MAPTWPAMRLQEVMAVMLLAEVPMAEPGARRGALRARPHGSWNRWLFLPSAASTAASGAVSPSTSSSPCALQQPGGRAATQKTEAAAEAREGAQHLPRGAGAGAERSRRACNPCLPVLSSDSGCGEPGSRASRDSAKERLPIAKPPTTTNYSPPPLPKPAGEGLSRVATQHGDTRGGAEGAEYRPFVMSP